MRKILFLSQLFATDRILLYSGLLEHLITSAQPQVWSRAPKEPSFPGYHKNSRYFQPFFHKRSLPEWISQLRLFNDYLWDAKKLSVSRQSIWKWIKKHQVPWNSRVLHRIAQSAAIFPVQQPVESLVANIAREHGSPLEIVRFFKAHTPSLVIAMTPFWPYEMSVIACAQRLAIPTAAFITSWDNISTKTRLLFDYDAYFVWSEAMKEELLKFYPRARKRSVFVVGAPQYDVFFDPAIIQPREAFCQQYSLDPLLPIVVYCLGSPNFIREDFAVHEYLKQVSRHADLKHIQVIVRTHPAFAESGYSEINKIRQDFPKTVIQGSNRFWADFAVQTEEGTQEWVNTIYHADVVINLSSTIAVDASIFDKPVINLNFDPEPGSPNERMVKEINSTWNHFSPIAHSGGVWLANNVEEVIEATRIYLGNPQLHSLERRWIAEHVCGFVDGKSGMRMAEAILSYVNKARNTVSAR